MTLPDSLSRIPSNADDHTISLDMKVCHVHFSSAHLMELRILTKEDPVLSMLMGYVINGFPETRRNMHSHTRSYWSFRDEIRTDDGILLKGTRIILSCLTAKFLQDLHQGHQGITRTQRRARSHVYWPNIMKSSITPNRTTSSNGK